MLGVDDKLPPQSIEAEQCTLGSLMIEAKQLDSVLDILNPEDFHYSAHRVIYEAIIDLDSRRVPIDTMTLKNHLESLNVLEDMGGYTYLMQLENAVPSYHNVMYYAGIVADKACRRQMIQSAREAIETMYSEELPIEEACDKAGALIFNSMPRQRADSGLIHGDVILESAINAYEKRKQNPGVFEGLSTGFDDFDMVTTKLKPGNLYIIASRPSMGKSAFGMGIAQNVSIAGKSVAVFSLEMSSEDLMDRTITSIARVDNYRYRMGCTTPEEDHRIAAAKQHMKGRLPFIAYEGEATPLRMRGMSRRLKAEKGLDLVVVDYLQLVKGDKKTENRTQEVGAITKDLKAMAKELKVPVIALAQVGRAVELRSDKRPALSDLRESGEIEAHADLVGFLFRPRYYESKDVRSLVQMEEAELIIAKQRNGTTGTVKLAFHPTYTRFDNLVKEFQTDSYAETRQIDREPEPIHPVPSAQSAIDMDAWHGTQEEDAVLI